MACGNYEAIGKHNSNCRNCMDSAMLHDIPTTPGQCVPETTPPPLLGANQRQVGGNHYKVNETLGGRQHWDMVDEFGLDYFQGQVTKYLFRWRHKNGVQDLEKARHFLDKYVELAQQREKRDAMRAYDTDVKYGADYAGSIAQAGKGVARG